MREPLGIFQFWVDCKKYAIAYGYDSPELVYASCGPYSCTAPTLCMALEHVADCLKYELPPGRMSALSVV
jgi:hypothetical protein